MDSVDSMYTMDYSVHIRDKGVSMMAWEIIDHRGNVCLWKGHDAEGKPVYAATPNREDGTPLEPNKGVATRKAAWDLYNRFVGGDY